MNPIISLSINEKKYKKNQVSILKNFKLDVEEGEQIAIIGRSGIGKSSLLNIIGLLDDDFDGDYYLFGKNVEGLSDAQKAGLRNKNIGFVLQDSALIDSLTVEENIKLPFLYSKEKDLSQFQNDFEEIVDSIGIKDILKKKPVNCSGGERSRAVFARGIIMKPDIILADEPTASLDDENKKKIIELLFDLHKEQNTTILLVTHDKEIAEMFPGIIKIGD
ncbi:MAG: ATP-binding cassette domain-containing protein [Lachnospiraceae bacterium]|jgi:putative ABC transport system ATP-binding protein|nr:ATP-binding cassette domain-containing protein [Lachnospiraceae bacterium]MEE3461224.1 ATP-binding cassette domain-containing protein [Lachnospiraceae bacterium]